MNILLLEDNFTDADLTQRGLTASIPNCVVELAQTLKQAKEILRKGIPFDIAILDMKLPDGTGMELLMEIRQSGIPLPVIILTGSGNEEVAAAALKAGADDYLVKNQMYLSKLPGLIDLAIQNHQQDMLLTSEIIKVLYIEHHSSDIDLTIRNFSQYAPQIHITSILSAEEALNVLPVNNNEPNKYKVILLDYRLPGLNAMEFTKIIRQERKLQIPIILVTGHGNEEVAIQALKLGVNEYLVKRDNYLLRLPSLIINAYQHQELIRKQRIIAESEIKYRLLADNSVDVIFTLDLDLNYTFISPSVYQLRGYMPEEVLGQNIIHSVTQASYEEAKQLIYSNLTIPNISGPELFEPVTIDLELIRKDNSTVWTEVKATVIRDEDNNPVSILGVTRDISHKKQYEEELFRSREEYKTFFNDDLTGDFLATIDGQLLNCNPAYIQILGLKNKEEALNLNFNHFYFKPEERNIILQNLEKHHRLFNYEYELVKADGRIVHVIANLIGIFDDQNELHAYRGYIFDNTERKLATDGLRKLSQAVEQSPVSIVITNKSGIIEYVNKKILQTTGYKPEELIGQNPRIFKPGDESETDYQELWDTISSGKEWFGEFHNKKKNGELFWESASISSIKNKNGEITHYVAVREDITRQKEMTGELVRAKEKAEESDRLKTAFLHNISHEIRTPLNSIVGFSEFVNEEEQLPEHLKGYTEIILKSSHQLLSIISDIVDVATIEAGQVKLYEKEFDLSLTLNLIHKQYTLEEQERNVVINFNSKINEKEFPIKADETKLIQILTNLIGNALKFTKNGYINYGYQIVKRDDNQTMIEFFVEDTGIGIPPEMHKEIFKRFRQVEVTSTRQFGGSGLGLSISKAYAELMGGRMWLESELGKGSKFYFTIPLKKALQV